MSLTFFGGRNVAGKLALPMKGLGLFYDWLDARSMRILNHKEVLLVLDEPHCYTVVDNTGKEKHSYALRCLSFSGVGFVGVNGVEIL